MSSSTFHTRIGDHVVRIDCDSAEFARSLQTNFLAFHADPGQETDLHLRVHGGYGSSFRSDEVKIAASDGQIVYERGDYRIESSEDFRQASIAVHDLLSARHALMTLYSALIVRQRWGLLLHSSSVVERGRAYVFAGRSGAGKSTAARLSAPRTLLADEATLIKLGPSGASVYPSPFHSEWPASRDAVACPPAGIYLLHQAVRDSQAGVERPDGLLRLLEFVFYWPHSSAAARPVLPLLKRLVDEVPVVDLYFRKNNAFWELIST